MTKKTLKERLSDIEVETMLKYLSEGIEEGREKEIFTLEETLYLAKAFARLEMFIKDNY